MECPHCRSTKIRKNGHTHYDKQNYLCTNCLRQFVELGQEWFVNDSDKALINKLLLERIPLSGICRVANIGMSWLLRYIKELYKDLPDDLNADLVLPEIDTYLCDRMDEEISRIKSKKKKSLAVENYIEVFDNEVIEDILDFESVCFDIEMNDLLINELYSKERCARVEFFGIQLDEMWTFVQNKANKQWLWLALNPTNRQIVAFHVGSRSSADALLFYEKIPDIFKGDTGFFSDYWQAYVDVFKDNNHFGVGKDSGLTAYIERFNGTLRQRASRLVRKSLSFSKSLENHIGAIKYFICHYNLQMKALH